MIISNGLVSVLVVFFYRAGGRILAESPQVEQVKRVVIKAIHRCCAEPP